jgi:hypothetical protein
MDKKNERQIIYRRQKKWRKDKWMTIPPNSFYVVPLGRNR